MSHDQKLFFRTFIQSFLFFIDAVLLKTILLKMFQNNPIRLTEHQDIFQNMCFFCNNNRISCSNTHWVYQAALDNAKRIVLSSVSLNGVNIVKITRSADFMKSRVSSIQTVSCDVLVLITIAASPSRKSGKNSNVEKKKDRRKRKKEKRIDTELMKYLTKRI